MNNQPIDGALVPRFAGIATFMRLPTVATAAGLDVALYGIPWTVAPPIGPGLGMVRAKSATSRA